MKKAIGALLAAALATVSAHAAVTVTTTATQGSSTVVANSSTAANGGVTFTFDGFIGTNGATTGNYSGFTFTNSGASLVNAPLNAPLFSGITNPIGDSSNFISVSSGGFQKILNGAASYNTLSVYWGSPDLANTLDLLDASGNSIYQLTTSAVDGLSGMSSALVTINSSQMFSGVKFGSSSGVNFELDNVGFSTTASAPGAVPEPATWAMMILGFGAVGYSLRQRSGRGRSLAA